MVNYVKDRSDSPWFLLQDLFINILAKQMRCTYVRSILIKREFPWKKMCNSLAATLQTISFIADIKEQTKYD
jgi:hypothetical protein